MTAKEKAKELLDKINVQTFSSSRGWHTDEEQTKEIALICVEEILESSPSLPILSDNGSYGSDIEESTNYWKEVKNQIQLL